jgi:hypothetical protein
MAVARLVSGRDLFAGPKDLQTVLRAFKHTSFKMWSNSLANKGLKSRLCSLATCMRSDAAAIDFVQTLLMVSLRKKGDVIFLLRRASEPLVPVIVDQRC